MNDIDVVIVTYNRNSLLRDLLSKLRKQTLKPGIIIADDGTLNPWWVDDMYSFKGVAWHPHTTYQRVAMVNAGLALVTAPYVIILDDDQLPVFDDFIETYLSQLRAEEGGVVRGLGATERRTYEPVPFFSTANLGLPMSVVLTVEGLDPRYNNYYGMEDRDFGRSLRQLGIPVREGNQHTVTQHVGIAYGVANPNVDRSRNERVYTEKWGDLNG